MLRNDFDEQDVKSYGRSMNAACRAARAVKGYAGTNREESVSRSGYIETRNAAYRGFRSLTAANKSLSKKLEM